MSEATNAVPGADGESEKLGAWIEQLVNKRIADGPFALPTIPAVALRGLEMLRNEDYSTKEIAALLQKDPIFAARVLRQASSAAFANSGSKLNLTDALARLGSKAMRTLLLEGAAQKIFVSKDPQIAAASRRAWEHSVAVAGISRDLAAFAGSSSSELAYLGGLLHDVGKPIVASLLLEAERQVEIRAQKWIDGPLWSRVIARTHRKVGVMLAEKWQLPPEVARCIKDCNEFDNADRGSIVNSVCLANAIAKQAGCAAGPVDKEDVDALVMIGRSMLGISEAVIVKMAMDIENRTKGLFEEKN